MATATETTTTPATPTTTTTTPPNIPPPSALRAALSRDGFVHIPSLLPASQISALRAAATSLTAAARRGDWPHIRTLPKQFPPWPSTPGADGIWGVQHLLHPSVNALLHGGCGGGAVASTTTFAESYFGDAVTGVCKALLQVDAEDDDGDGDGDAELVMELYNMLVRPDRDFELRWHRDDIGPDVGPEEELARLTAANGGGAPLHAQWNLALFEDRSLVVVPGSHRRARTEAERGAAPYAAELPGMQVVVMQPGDCVFYDNNILHRGVYDKERERMTLHGSVGLARGGKERARNVLQHGVGEWVGECDFSGLPDGIRQRAEGMRERLVKMGSDAGDVGYFSKDE
ncbi:phytanoyl-dioxygenase [Diplodia corticola]|uniref:Phytanoyl-dioxygenase n=1 Tax=Diplodia corticola TaxID=236234 RepID=A0A1J9QRN9_9PEZI|nr:phytanoyl-dioxygenase [Diplodia corticola]OJD31614.1 phytanoyl-dioxygenase [Diplodia corticola]